MNKWYMHNPDSVLENDAHIHLCDFEIKTDHLISSRRPNLIKKKNLEKKKHPPREPSELWTLQSQQTIE